MNILNVNFNEINAKRENKPKGQININNNIKIENIEDSKIGAADKKKGVKISFKFSTDYEPGYAHIELKGSLLLLEDAKKAKEMLDNWKNKKNLNQDYGKTIIQAIMNRSLIETVIISREIDLPTPIRLPTVTDKTESK